MNAQIEECMVRAFALLQHEWVVDFLFSDHDVLLLTALHSSEKIFGSFSCVTDPTLPIRSEHDLDERGNMMFVSSFNRGLYTAGYEICHRKKSVQAVPLNKRYIARTVRDDYNGQLFSVAHHPDLQVTEIAFCHPQTPGYRQQGVFMFRTNLFENVVNNVRNGNALDFRALRHALAYSFLAAEWRQCPNCQSFNSQFCGCAVESRLKWGPNDFHHDRDSLFLHGGAYNGLVNVSVFALPGAPPLLQRTVGSFSSIGLLENDAETHSMCTWAMSTLNDKYPVDLFHMNIMGADDAQQAPDAADQLVQYDRAANLRLDLEDPSTFFADSDARGVAIESNVRTAELQNILTSGQRVGSEGVLSILGEQTSIEAMNDADISTSPLLLGNNSADDVITDLLSSITARSPQGERVTAEELSRALVETTSPVTSQLVAALHSTNSSMSNKRANHGTQTRSNQQSPPPNNSSASDVQVGRRAVPIAPASSGTVGNRSAVLDANQIRLARRKARNRASAQRSNLKKKLAMQKMKEELAQLSEQQSQLRVEERKLREENLRLRAELPTVGR